MIVQSALRTTCVHIKTSSEEPYVRFFKARLNSQVNFSNFKRNHIM